MKGLSAFLIISIEELEIEILTDMINQYPELKKDIDEILSIKINDLQEL